MAKVESQKKCGLDTVYGKYIILDAETGKSKKGKYFVLKINAKNAKERRAVRISLHEYVVQQRRNGRWDYAQSVEQYAGCKNDESYHWLKEHLKSTQKCWDKDHDDMVRFAKLLAPFVNLKIKNSGIDKSGLLYWDRTEALDALRAVIAFKNEIKQGRKG